jgi:hypothetical protein
MFTFTVVGCLAYSKGPENQHIVINSKHLTLNADEVFSINMSQTEAEYESNAFWDVTPRRLILH